MAYTSEMEILAAIEKLVQERILAAISEGVFDFEADLPINISFKAVTAESYQPPEISGAILRIIAEFKVVPSGKDV